MPACVMAHIVTAAMIARSDIATRGPADHSSDRTADDSASDGTGTHAHSSGALQGECLSGHCREGCE